ncbi:MAG TPA: hypothetical protein EYP46_04510 [Hadesarchaea archaeon]|nr:hypothetical protein [Hadesarchaea archaeon]
MGDFTKAAILIMVGFAIFGLMFLFIENPFSDVGIILMVVIALLWAVGFAFFVRGKEKWWRR